LCLCGKAVELAWLRRANSGESAFGIATEHRPVRYVGQASDRQRSRPHRVGEIAQAFQSAITECQYQGDYCCVYPIKVNQQRQVVEEVFEYGRPYRFGLEAGSKPELLAVLAIADNETPIVCNGFKDDEYIEMVMLAEKILRERGITRE